MNKSLLIAGGVIAVVLVVGIFFAMQPRQQVKNADAVQEPQRLEITDIPTNMPAQPNNSERRQPFPSGAQMPFPSGGMQAPDAPNGSQPFFGTVSNFDTPSFTIQSSMGEYKILITSATEFKDGSLSDLKNDIRVAGYGTKNSDNTITALQIRINPSMPNRGQFPPQQ